MVKPGLQICILPMVASIVNNDNDRLLKGIAVCARMIDNTPVELCLGSIVLL